MLRVYICEDNDNQRAQLTQIIENCIAKNKLDMMVVVSTPSPDSVLLFLENNEGVSGLYFLDMDLNCDTDGIALAEKIRKYDPRGFIVFVTAHAETLNLTFKHKVEALDFIVKDDFRVSERVCECLQDASIKYKGKNKESKDYFVLKSNQRIIPLKYDEILYFESSQGAAHKIIVYTDGGIYSFYGKIRELEKNLGGNFFRCHKSYIINLMRVSEIDTDSKKVYFDSSASCCVSTRLLTKLNNILKMKNDFSK